MSEIGKPERETRRRVIALFCDDLEYQYLVDWSDPEEHGKATNSNIEETLLAA